MAWPDPGRTATWDKTGTTMGRTVDSTLWPMIVAKSQLLDRIQKTPVDNTYFEWETANTFGKTFTAAAANGATDVSGSGSGTKIGCGSGLGLTVQKGALLRNVSVATPIGTYGADEIMQVTANDGTDITVVRDYARQNTGTGSTAHTTSTVYEILFSPKEEGSSPDLNKYTDVSITGNYTNILDFYLTVTGSQLASKRLLPADSLQRQFDDRLVELKNDMESMVLYGALNNDANPGSDTKVRTTKGFQNFISNATAYANGVVDYATKAVTEEALNQLIANMYSLGVDLSQPLLVAAHPNNIRTISQFGADKVRITQSETKWGRALKEYESDLGVTMELCPVLNMSKSDLFIINLSKIALAEFRPFMKFEWGMDTSTPDGTDAWKQRYLGEYGVKVVDGTKAHAAIQYITWV